MSAVAEQPHAVRDEERPAFQKSLTRDYLETILICVMFVIFSRAFVFQQSKIPSGSMKDTLLEGDYIMVNRFVYSQPSFAWESKLLPQRPLRRGDVVVFKQPQEPETDYIKRLIGLPGDVIELRRSYVFINGEPIDEPYIDDKNRLRGQVNFGPVVVQPDHYFMMGDNRDESYDSRDWGQVDRDLIKGRALIIWYSFPEDGRSHLASVPQVLRSWVEKAIYFIPRSRWSRCFSLIR